MRTRGLQVFLGWHRAVSRGDALLAAYDAPSPGRHDSAPIPDSATTTMAIDFQASESPGFFEQLIELLQPETLMSWEFWIVASAILVVAEFLTAGFLLGAFIPGTLLSALLAAFGVGMNGQLWGFILGTMVGLIVLRPIVVRRARLGGVPSNVEALIGQPAIVTEAISATSFGRIKVRGEEWRASAEEGLESGAEVRIVAIEGSTVHVQAQN